MSEEQTALEEVCREVQRIIEPYLLGAPWPDWHLRAVAETVAEEHGLSLSDFTIEDGELRMRLRPKQEFITVTIIRSEEDL